MSTEEAVLHAAAISQKLTGNWSGHSESRNNVRTLWQNTHITFRPANLGSQSGTPPSHPAHFCDVEGHGTSFWEEKHIKFHLEGMLDLSNMQIKIFKFHEGPYNNVVKYEGLLDSDTFQIQGNYDRGTISLKMEDGENPGTFVVVSCSNDPEKTGKAGDVQVSETDDIITMRRQLAGLSTSSTWKEPSMKEDLSTLCERWSGSWKGYSHSNTNKPTMWTKLTLKFVPFNGTNNTHSRIIGDGISKWNEEEVPFKVEGFCHWESQSVKLIKSHFGKYQNSILYWASVKRNFQIEGSYKNPNGRSASGNIILRRIGGGNHETAGRSGENFQEADLTSSTRSSSSAKKSPTSIPDSITPEIEAKIESEMPNEFKCPITCDIMSDPVIAWDGHSYERAAIKRWFRESNSSPKTNEVLESKQLLPNHSLRSQILAFKEKWNM